MIKKYISIPIFLVSLLFGFLFVYLLGPQKKIVYVYPSPENYKKYLYRDYANQCYEYIPQPTTCPSNPLNIKTIPTQK